MRAPVHVVIAVALGLGTLACDGGSESSADDPFPGACGTQRNVPFSGTATHVPTDTEVEYGSTPPAAGDHYGLWTSWGESADELDPRNWVHNLEHGGAVFLYDCPEGCPDIVDAARAFGEARPDDDGGAFRWVLTPYSGMEHRFALVAWEWLYEADCWSEADVLAFLDLHYRQAPEDVSAPPPGGP